VPRVSVLSLVPSMPVTETDFYLVYRVTYSAATPPLPFFQRVSLSMASASTVTDHNVDLEAQRGVQHSFRASPVFLGSSYYLRSANMPRERGGVHAISINFGQSEMEDDSSLSLPTSTDQGINSSVEPVIPQNEGATSDFPSSFSLYSNTLSSMTPSRRRGNWVPRGER